MSPTTSVFRKLVAAALLAAAVPAFAGDLEEGLKLKAAGQFEGALPLLQKASDADPKNADAALAYSEVLSGLGKYEQAARVLGDAIEAHPDDIRLPLQRGRAFMLEASRIDAERGDPNAILAYVADADRWIKKVLEKDPKHSEARVLKARVLMFQGSDREKVVEELMGVVKDDPKAFDAHWELGQIAVRKARTDKDRASWGAAEKHFRDAFAADPKSGQALLQATYAKAWQGIKGSSPELVKDYGTCALLLPNDDAPCVAMFKLRKQADAAAVVRSTLEQLAKDPAAGARARPFLALVEGEAALAEGKADEAVKAFCRAAQEYAGEGKEVYLALYPPVVQKTVTRDQPVELSTEQREQIAEAAWAKWPARSEIPNDFALYCRDGANDYPRSLKWYLRAAEAAPTSPRVLNDTGLIYHYHVDALHTTGSKDAWRAKAMTQAEEWYRKAIAAAEEQGIEWSNDRNDEGMGLRDALNNLALILQSQKRTKELRELAEKHMPEDFPGRERWLKAD